MEIYKMTAQEYIVSFLLGENAKNLENRVFYGLPESAPSNAEIVIVPSDFFDDGVYGTSATMPETPFAMLPDSNIPFLFGEPRLEKNENGRLILYADLVASSYFMLSRYEETIKLDCRDQHGRFLAKDSVVFQQKYGMRPLVDEWGNYLRNLLRKSGVDLPAEKSGFRKIYLTHDIDTPFFLWRKKQVLKQLIKNLIHYGRKIQNPYRVYRTGVGDPYNNFSRIIGYDSDLKNKMGESIVESVYFMIAAGNSRTESYCDIELPKYQVMLKQLEESGAEIGLHASYEAGADPMLLKTEMERMFKYCGGASSKNRHHFLRWREPEHIDEMENAGITEDFTLGYADCAGFRVGTCRPYKFINPRSKRVTDIVIHPMEIMECSLDRKIYMGLDFESAKHVCKEIAAKVYEHGGELNILWHNSSFLQSYYDELYKEVLKYAAAL